MKHTLAAVAAMLSLSACSGEQPTQITWAPIFGPSSVRVTSLDTVATAGSLLNVRFESQSAQGVWFYPCTREVQRLVSGVWQTVPEADRWCFSEVYLLAPQTVRTERTHLTAGLGPGTYRFAYPASFVDREGVFLLLSSPFRVAEIVD